MSVNLPLWYVQQYATTISLLLQQKTSHLRPFVTSGTLYGKAASPLEQLGAVAMQPVVGRFQPMGRVDAPLDRRWCYPLDFDLPQQIDTFDKLRLLVDPTSAYCTNAASAANRQFDDIILQAFSGTAKTGETGATSVVFPASQIVANNFGASAATGLTVSKIREGKRILMKNQVDILNDPLVCVINAQANDNLLAEAQIISLDYTDKPVLNDGIIKRFLGINFVYCERTLLDVSANNIIPLFAQSGMYFGIWNDITTKISERADLQGIPWQVYLYLTAGATRLEEKKCVQLLCV